MSNHKIMKKSILLLLFTIFLFPESNFAQVMPSPDRKEGDGPYDRLILRGVNLIDGTGSPTIGPVDIVVEKNRIVEIKVVGYPEMPMKEDRRPKAGPNDKVMDLEGHYLLPGLIDMHGHIGGVTFQLGRTVCEDIRQRWEGQDCLNVDV